MEKLFKQVFIKSESDLPKEEGEYIVHYKKMGGIESNYDPNNEKHKLNWIANIDWYLQPLPESPEAEEINEPINDLRTVMILISARIDRYDRMSVSDLQALWNSLSDIVTKLNDLTPKPKGEEHYTCDGCQMFGDNGCNLDVSICPDCFEYSMWTPKGEDDLIQQIMNDIDNHFNDSEIEAQSNLPDPLMNRIMNTSHGIRYGMKLMKKLVLERLKTGELSEYKSVK